MGFLKGMGRVLAGKPVFTPEETIASQQGLDYPGDNPASLPTDTEGNRLIPEVKIWHIDAQLNDTELVILAEILNDSEQGMHVDRITALGQTTELDRELKPGHGYAVEIYQGPAPKGRPPAEASVEYRLTLTSNTLQAQYQVDFYQQDEYFLPGEFRLDGTVREI